MTTPEVYVSDGLELVTRWQSH